MTGPARNGHLTAVAYKTSTLPPAEGWPTKSMGKFISALARPSRFGFGFGRGAEGKIEQFLGFGEGVLQDLSGEDVERVAVEGV